MSLELYRKWNKQNVKELKVIADSLPQDHIGTFKLRGIIAAMKTEGVYLDKDIKYENDRLAARANTF
jgi:hypothetical protein